MARCPVKKVSAEIKPVCVEDQCNRGIKTFIMFSTDQSTALLNHLSHTRSKLGDQEKRNFDDGPLGQILKNLGGR